VDQLEQDRLIAAILAAGMMQSWDQGEALTGDSLAQALGAPSPGLPRGALTATTAVRAYSMCFALLRRARDEEPDDY